MRYGQRLLRWTAELLDDRPGRNVRFAAREEVYVQLVRFPLHPRAVRQDSDIRLVRMGLHDQTAQAMDIERPVGVVEALGHFERARLWNGVLFRHYSIRPQINTERYNRGAFMQVVLLPEKWRVWLDAEDRQIEATLDTPVELVEYLSRDDLDFQGGQAGGEDFHISLAPETRSIRSVQDLIEIVRGLIDREEHDIAGYDIRRGPKGSLDWEGAGTAPPEELSEEAKAEQAGRWNDQTAVDITKAKPSQLAAADAWADYHASGDPSELIEMGVLPAERE